MARQTSIQLTQATESQIAALKRNGFGTFTDIVRLAVDRMYRDELEALEGKMTQVTHISVEYSEDGLFGAEGSGGYDLRASFDKFEEQLMARLSAEYPHADEIKISNGIGDYHKVLDVEGMEIESDTEIVGSIIHEVWSEWDWLVAQ